MIAAFRKADLQLHSPRDSQWKGPRAFPEGDQPTHDQIRDARQEWADRFIDACVSRELQLVAITDHHEGVFCWIVAERLRARKDSGEVLDLHLLPGMELTCKDSAQAILLFDADLPRALFEKARSKLSLPTDCSEHLSVGIAVNLLSANVDELQAILEADSELKGRFIILPNVTPKGHKTVLRVGFHKRFADMPYVGGYLDKVYPQNLDATDLKKLQGDIPAWGSQRRGIVATSDAREDDFRTLGEFSTWIKIAVPTAEALRQALLAADSRLSYAAPESPSFYIESVEVSGAAFLALDAPVRFSSQYNAIIGGRGAGKSTLLEYIRFGLGRSALDVAREAWDTTHERRRALLASTLDAQTGQVTLRLRLDGALVTVSRRRASPDQIQYTIGDAERVVSPADLRNLLSAQVFSQGELSQLGDESASDRLLDLLTEPSRDILDEISKESTETSTKLRELLSKLQSAWSAERALRRLDVELATLDARINSLREQLTSANVDDQKSLDEHQVYQDADGWLLQTLGSIDDGAALIGSAFRQFDRSIGSLLADGTAPSHPALTSGIEALRAALSQLNASRDDVQSLLVQTRASVDDSAVRFAKARAEHELKYSEALARMTGAQSSADLLDSLTNDASRLRSERDSVAEIAETANGLLVEFVSTEETYAQLQERRAKAIQLMALDVEARTGGMAAADLDASGNSSELRDALVELFSGTRVREERLDALMQAVASDTTVLAGWRALVGELLTLLRAKTIGLVESAGRPAAASLDTAIDSGGLERMVERLTPERLLAVALAQLKPKVQFFQIRKSQRIPFQQSSQGEKVSILLSLLMQQAGGPLLLDQPEEDLDNRIIGDVVNATREAKKLRQLLVATHNANLVVNGDAELVAEFAGGRVSALGAIDLESIRTAIAATMEGGRDAFELRRRKYNF